MRLLSNFTLYYSSFPYIPQIPHGNYAQEVFSQRLQNRSDHITDSAADLQLFFMYAEQRV